MGNKNCKIEKKIYMGGRRAFSYKDNIIQLAMKFNK